jgi:hypothetical protein
LVLSPSASILVSTPTVMSSQVHWAHDTYIVKFNMDDMDVIHLEKEGPAGSPATGIAAHFLRKLKLHIVLFY